MEELRKLEEWLRGTEEVGETVLMPLVPGKKQPASMHKKASKEGRYQWGWEEYEAYRASHASHREWGLLLDELCAIDADDEETWRKLHQGVQASTQMALASCPVQVTRKGRHYLFLRPSYADEEGYYDGARQAASKKSKLNADFKSRCAGPLRTRGVLVVAPSENKHWLEDRAPWDEGVILQEMPRELLEAVASAKNKTASSKVVGRSTHRKETETAPGAHDDVQALLQLLNKSRWDDRSSWRDIATALKNHAGDKYKGDWMRLSRSSAKYNEAEAEKLWCSVAESGYVGPRLTLGSLHHMASKDDPLGYGEFRMRRIPEVVLENWDEQDWGLAKIAAHLLADQIKSVGRKGDMYCFDEGECRWRLGDESQVWHRVSDTLKQQLRDVEAYCLSQARASTDGATQAAWEARKNRAAERCRYVRKLGGIRTVTTLAAPLLKDDAFEQRLDAKRHLLGVKNGVVDLRTGALRCRTPEDMIATVLDVEYDPEADTSLFAQTIKSAMADDMQMVDFLQRMLGYAITGETCEAVFPVFTGEGGNSKGLITQTLRKLLACFYREMHPGLIVKRSVANEDAERGKLLGARLAVFNELEPGEKLRTSEVQMLSGGDGIAAAPKHRDPITIEPRHMCLLTTNYMPQLTEVKQAILRRLLCIHFPVIFTNLAAGEEPTLYRRQCDQTLPERLLGALPGVLTWLVQGAVKWYARPNLLATAPDKVTEFSRQYFETQDHLQQFISSVCEEGAGGSFRVRHFELHSAYVDWARQNNAPHLTSKAFTDKLGMKGFKKKDSLRVKGWSTPQRGYEGLRLITDGAFADIDADI